MVMLPFPPGPSASPGPPPPCTWLVCEVREQVNSSNVSSTTRLQTQEGGRGGTAASARGLRMVRHVSC